MYIDLVKMLRCPVCKSDLNLFEESEEFGEIIQGKLCCCSGHEWRIHEGVVDFGSQEQTIANNWSENYKERDFDSLDREVCEKTPENTRLLFGKTASRIVDITSGKDIKYILDIASGRGMLLTELVKSVDSNKKIISIDLSFEVLKYDRIKARRIDPGVKCNFIACDGTNLPFKNSIMDACVSFYGIANMMDFIKGGIVEARRVLKSGGIFANASILIQNDSKGYQVLKEFCTENKMGNWYEFSCQEGFKNYHIESGLDNIELLNTGESIGEKNELDLLPFENEWFMAAIAYCKKSRYNNGGRKMDKQDVKKMLSRGLVVSCQALEDEPLHSSYIMSRMAVAAKTGGAVGIRSNSAEDIKAIKEAVDLPVIGIIKKDYEGFKPYITPTIDEVKAVIEAGADIIAMDATKSLRPGNKTFSELLEEIKSITDKPVMADISTYEEGIDAEKAGADIVSTTLSGYTDYSPKLEGPDFELLERLARDVNIPVIAEGRIWTPEEAKKALELGAYAVVVGGAITRPQNITKRFVDFIGRL